MGSDSVFAKAFAGGFFGKLAGALFIAICLALGFGPDKWAKFIVTGFPTWVTPGLAQAAFVTLAMITFIAVFLPLRKRHGAPSSKIGSDLPESSADAVHTVPTIQTGMGGDYDLREPSRYGGILHTIRVKIINDSESMLIGAKLSIINLNPASANHRNLPLPQSIDLSPGESTYVRVSSHTEGAEADQNVMQLQTSYPGGFAMPNGFGILTCEHRLQLRLTRNEDRLAEIYCRLYVDDHNVMRLESLDKCGAQNGP
jgi:hypothetical protein